MNTNIQIAFFICGIAGGILCACGDILFDLKGAGNKKLGTSGNIDSNWTKMADWRFGLSIFCALIGDACVGLSLIALSFQIAKSGTSLAGILSLITIISGMVGIVGGVFVHSTLCIQALVFKGITEKSSFEVADFTIEKVYRQLYAPFFTGYICLMVPFVTTIIAICNGILDVPFFLVFLNSITFMIFGILLRKINPKVFQDLPGICMPSLGLCMLGVIGLVSVL